mgnify:FL=1
MRLHSSIACLASNDGRLVCPNSSSTKANLMGYYYQRFKFNAVTPEIEGNFMHETQWISATPQLLEALEDNELQFTVHAQDSEEVFEIVAKLEFVRLQNHYYQRSSAESDKWNAKDAKKNKDLFREDGTLADKIA